MIQAPLVTTMSLSGCDRSTSTVISSIDWTPIESPTYATDGGSASWACAVTGSPTSTDAASVVAAMARQGTRHCISDAETMDALGGAHWTVVDRGWAQPRAAATPSR